MSGLSAFWRKQRTRLYRGGIDRRHQLRRHLAYYVLKHGFEIGDYSAGVPSIAMWNEGARLRVGKYCSIAEGVRFVLGGSHQTAHVTTFPLGMLTRNFTPEDLPYSRGDIVIGSDVWIGMDAVVLSGVTIGDGAVIGAGAVVRDDVPPYVIVVGNPARSYGKRFSDAVIRQLLELRWWDLDHKQIMAMRSLLQSEKVEAVIEACSRIRGVPSPQGISSSTPDLLPPPAVPSNLEVRHRGPRTEAAISSWCVNFLATLLEVPAEQIDMNTTFARLGLDSVARAEFTVALEESLNVAVTPDDIVERPTIAALARYLAVTANRTPDPERF